MKSILSSKKLTQIIAFGFILCVSTYGVIASVTKQPVKIPTIKPFSGIGWQNGGPIKSRMTLSQNKVLQGTDGMIYMKVDLEAGEVPSLAKRERTPTDFVIVLDRSGSMSGKNKMGFAHKAIESLLYQVNDQDRIALVTFDDRVEVPLPLKAITNENRGSAIRLVNDVTPRGSTNLGAGLTRGMAVLNSAKYRSNRAQRLIIISDGMTNAGITSVSELSNLAGKAVSGEFVISTIGVGLDFNETLLSSLADHGTGSYHFLENVAKLDKILADEFYGASQILAKGLELELKLASGIKVLEASGYPLEHNGRNVIVKAGHLYQKQNKTFYVTLKVPTDSVFSDSLGEVIVKYDVENEPYRISIAEEKIQIACLPAENKGEVIASIDKDTYNSAWTENNFGGLLKKSGTLIGNGSFKKAKKEIGRYRDQLKDAYAQAPSPELKTQIQKLDSLEEEVDDAATGGGEQVKRLSKQYHSEGYAKQRVESKK